MASSAMKRSLRLVFLGAPGAGKGTYASRLARKWNIPQVSTGDMVREEMKKGSTLGKTVAEYSQSGRLVPDEVINEIAKARLMAPDAASGYILDGYPRSVSQAQYLETIASPQLCINLFLPTHLLIQKISGRRVCAACGANYNIADINEGEFIMPPLLPSSPEKCDHCAARLELLQREDDKEDIVTKRLEVYEADTAPLIAFYHSLGILESFNVKRGVADLPDLEVLILRRLEKEIEEKGRASASSEGAQSRL